MAKKVDIHVRGSHTAELPPTRATVHATVSQDGPDPAPVFAAVTASLGVLRSSIEVLHHRDNKAVTWFAIDQVRLGSHRPWNSDREQLPLVHNATVSVTVRFRDFDALGRWVSANAGLAGLNVGAVDWTLTRRSRLRAERRARQEALRDARRRAQDYADALGLGKVRVRTVSDPGLAGPVQRKVMLAGAMAAAPAGPPEIDLRPKDVEVHAEVEATFVADGG